MNRIAALVLVPALVLAGTVTSTVTVSRSELSFSRHEGYDVVELARGLVVPDPGRPSIPEMTVTLVVPARAEVTGVTAVPLATEEIPGTFNLLPSQPARPLSLTEPVPFVPPDPAVYSSGETWPGAALLRHSTGNAAGFRLVSVSISPLQYVPADSRLSLHTRVRVSVDYRTNAAPALVPTPTQRERTRSGLVPLVANPADLKRFAPRAAETDQAQIDYLVITGDLLAPEFEPFLAYRTVRGLRTELRTVEWIDRNCTGRDLPEKTRNLIIDYYRTRGLSYVLLASDNAIVPSRRVRVWVGRTRGDIPTDLYYGDLDYSWDSNNNHIFGEVGIDSVDLYADVLVGRASVDNVTEVQTFIDKVRTYEENPAPDYIKRALLPSGWLWYPSYHGSIVNDSIADQTPADWSDIKMVNPASALVVADSFDNGFAIFDPSGHGNANGVYDEDGTSIYTSAQARSQTNDRRFTIMTSLACTPGNFEYEDCIAEHAHNCAAGGCIGVMMNSRYGWGTPPSMGPSEKVCIRFYDYFLNHDQYVIGSCHDRSREVYAGTAQYNSLWRWCTVQFNLLGDPALDIWSEPPTQLALDATDTIPSGQQTLQVAVTTEGSPVPDALVCAFKQGEVFATGRTSGSGTVSLDVHPITAGTINVTATCHNCLPGESRTTVIPGAPEPFVIFFSATIDDPGQAHPNGILEPGETGTLTLTVKNAGTALAANTRLVLRRLTGTVIIPDSTASLGDIAAGDTASTADLTLTAPPDILPGSSPELLAVVSADGYDWELEFPVHIGYPGRVTAEIDTGSCALTLTARGAIGFDNETPRAGRGFRFPETDTSCLNIASFCLGNSADYLVDRFYTNSEHEMDTDWVLVDSLYAQLPAWNSNQHLLGVFNDEGHARPEDIQVTQHGLGIHEQNGDNFVILVYDIVNNDNDPVCDLYAGILADFDIIPTDRLHDVAYTASEYRTAYMRNVAIDDLFCGVKLLNTDLPCYPVCLDHERYIYPDSGLTEDMKLRFLKGELGSSGSDRAFNWSVAVGAGPFDLEPDGGSRRLSFAFIAATSSISYLTACRNSQEWYEDNVGIAGPGPLTRIDAARFTILPNPFARSASIRFNTAFNGPVTVQAFNTAGRLVADIYSGRILPGETVRWNPEALPAGVYVVRLHANGKNHYSRVALVR